MKKFIVAVAALAMMAGSAYAADWNFYGSARVDTFWTDVDVIEGASGDTNVQQSLMGTSRIGANVKVSDELSGRFEYGGTVNMRLLYGEWNFGAGTLTVGQDYTPIYIAYSNQAFDDDGLGDTGDVYSGRQAQIKLTFGEFQIAAVAPNTNVVSTRATSTTRGALESDTEVVLPTIEARYTYRFDNGSVRAVAGYNTFDATAADLSVNSYVLGLGATATFGNFTLSGNFHVGENSGNIIGVDSNNWNKNAVADGDKNLDGLAVISGGQVLDNEVMGYNLVVAYKINDMFGLEAGYGYIETEIDGDVSSDEACSYYIQAPITLAPGVMVVPEYGVYDYEEAGQQEKTYFGAKWQINF